MINLRALLLSSLFLCSFQRIEDQAKVSILTPSFADRKVAKLRLDNGLEAYIISDPHLLESAAALSVEVGSWHDPEEYPGMAHFLEHMLFMGSSAYPDEAEYSRFIHDNGGSDNAFTASDRTVYVFSIGHDAFIPALDRFSHFFIDPLFSPSSVEREMHAVDEEYSLNKNLDNFRKLMVLKETGNQEHPNCAFDIGCLETLSGIPQSALKEWHEKHYSADIMHLVLLSPEPIDTLINAAETYFSAIPKKDDQRKTHAHSLFSLAQKGQMIYVNSEANTLELIWEVPQHVITDNEKRALDVTAIALEHPLQNSLYKVLKRKGLAQGVSASVDQMSKKHLLFVLTIELTDKGLFHIEETAGYCYQALANLRQAEMPSFIFDEMQLLETVSYQYQSRQDAYDTVLFHADHLVDEKLETYPEKTFLPKDFDPSFIGHFIASLTSDSCICLVSGELDKIGIDPDKVEKWSGVEYALKTIPRNVLSKWARVSPHPGIDFPPQNPFLPRPMMLEILGAGEPKLVEDSADARFYFAQDNTYLVPELCTLFTFYSPILDGSAKSEVLLSLFFKNYARKMSDISYFARKAGIRYGFYHDQDNFSFNVRGYSDQLPPFVKEGFSQLAKTECTEEEFETFRQELEDSLYETYDPSDLAKVVMQYVLFPDMPTDSQKSEALNELTFEDYQNFSRNLIKNVFIEGTLFGNLKEEEAKSICQILKSTLPEQKVPYIKNEKNEIALPDKGLTTYTMDGEEEGNAALVSIYQGKLTPEKRAAQKILSKAIKEAFFDTLRTKQQTGYLVSSWDQVLENELFQFFSVQSSQYSPEDLIKRFETFFITYRKKLKENIPQERFDTLRQSLIFNLRAPAENLSAHASELHTLAFKKKDFHYPFKIADALENLSYEDFLKFAQATLSKKTPRIGVLIKDINEVEEQE